MPPVSSESGSPFNPSQRLEGSGNPFPEHGVPWPGVIVPCCHVRNLGVGGDISKIVNIIDNLSIHLSQMVRIGH